MMSQADWKCRHAALMAISAAGEGCHKQMESYLGQIMDAVMQFVNDPVSLSILYTIAGGANTELNMLNLWRPRQSRVEMLTTQIQRRDLEMVSFESISLADAKRYYRRARHNWLPSALILNAIIYHDCKPFI